MSLKEKEEKSQRPKYMTFDTMVKDYYLSDAMLQDINKMKLNENQKNAIARNIQKGNVKGVVMSETDKYYYADEKSQKNNPDALFTIRGRTDALKNFSAIAEATKSPAEVKKSLSEKSTIYRNAPSVVAELLNPSREVAKVPEEKQKGKQDATTSVYFEYGTQQFSFKFKTNEEAEQFKFENESLHKQFKTGEITKEQYRAGQAHLIAGGVLNCDKIYVASKKEAPLQKGLDLKVPDVELARFELTQKERTQFFKEYSEMAENYFALYKKKESRKV